MWNYLREPPGEDFCTVVSRSCEKRAVAEGWQKGGGEVDKGSVVRREEAKKKCAEREEELPTEEGGGRFCS